jgi:mannose-6-phosphate isomerase
MLYPLVFQPIYKERVWGGRNLERLFQKRLPEGETIGESWEISDRPDDASVIINGPLAGKDLRWLMENHAKDLLGTAPATPENRFPLLIKILDAQTDLSVQVHPPVEIAQKLQGEPKTEMWYIADATPEAGLYAGLKNGTTREIFENKLKDGSVAECIHRLEVKAGDALFLPSGRIHAIGGGNVIFEIQQNSDTTYRVFDWNRLGLDGKPRQLHIQESMESIDFNDFEPSLIQSIFSRNQTLAIRFVVQDKLFMVDACQAKKGLRFYLSSPAFQILAILKGHLEIHHQDQVLELVPGQFCLLPASLDRVRLNAVRPTEFLHIQPGSGT